MSSSKTTLILTLLALLTAFTFAAPPACVIGAVNTQSNPHDIAAVCKASEVQDSINKNCGDAKEAAQKWFSEVCKGAGVTVASTVSSSSSSASSAKASGSSSSSSSNSDDATVPTSTSSTKGQSGAQASTSAGSERPDATGGAARLGMDVVGLMALGAFGAMVAL